MLPKIFLFFICDSQTGNCYYLDVNGNIQRSSILSGIDVSLKQAPEGWLTGELSFIRNTNYYGINRSFSQPMKFVKDAAKILRTLTYTGSGIETALTLVILRYNETPKTGEPLYKIYYKGGIDFSKQVDMVAEGFECNLLESGMTHLLKTYENTVFQIPCDGSIPENLKVNCDGLYLPDTFHYNIGFSQPQNGKYADVDYSLQTFYIANDGDNFGILHYDQNFTSDWKTQPQFQSTDAITIQVKGNVIVRPYSSAHGNNPFYLAVTGSRFAPDSYKKVTADLAIYSEQNIYFDFTYTLAANEKFYFLWHNDNIFNPMAVESGSFQIIFVSKAQATSPWAVSALDLFKLLVKNICLAASTTNQTFEFDAISNLLQNNLNLNITSGDALRASGDANYQKYFQNVQINQNRPSSNITRIYGPVIKTSLSDFYKSMTTILFGSLGNQQLTGDKETIFFEDMGFVFNTSKVTMNIGEVANLKVIPKTDWFFSNLKIGYEGQSYDQKAGKYEYNTQAEFITPLKAQQKELKIVSKYRADSYGIERLRSNIGNSTSSTRNDSDNSVFILNTDKTKFSQDTQTAAFVSLLNSYDNAENTNIRLLPYQSGQAITMSTVQGSYFSMLNNPALFVFSQSGFSQNIAVVYTYSGTLYGNPYNALTKVAADNIKITLFLNGVAVYTNTFTCASAATPFNDTFTLPSSVVIKEGDVIYSEANTSVNGFTDNLTATLSVGNVGSYFTAIGTAITIPTGSASQLISLPNVTAPLANNAPVVRYGFQFFQFNSILISSTFNVSFTITAVLQDGSPQTIKYQYFKNNGGRSTTIVNNSPNNRKPVTTNFSDTQTFILGDIVYLLADLSALNVQIQNVAIVFSSTSIKKYSLKRIQYDALLGIPNSVKNTTDAGTPYNIEDLTPKRIFNKWKPWIASMMFLQEKETISFSTLTKNQFLNTRLNGQTIMENDDVHVTDLGNPLFLPYLFEFEFKVPLNFADLLTGMANAHVQFTYNGISFYGFPMEMKQKTALNEKQSAKLLCSPITNIQNLVNLDFDGLNFINMPPNSLNSPYLSPFQFVPESQIMLPKYHTRDMNMFWFSEQVLKWTNQNNYWQPVQIGDIRNIQFQTRDLSPVTAFLYNADGTIAQTVALTQKTSNAIVVTNYLWEGTIDFTSIVEGTYYVYINAANVGFLISEGLVVYADCPNSLLFEYSNSVNKQSVIFDTGFTTAMRVNGFIDNKMKPKYKGAFYVDQPQDITILNAIPYEIRDLWIGIGEGVPDYVIKKISRIMLLDKVFIEGVQYSLDDNAEWEEIFIEGNPKKFWKTTIRLAKNVDGISITTAGGIIDTSMIVTVDANAFGPNAGNAAGTTTPLITTITIS